MRVCESQKVRQTTRTRIRSAVPTLQGWAGGSDGPAHNNREAGQSLQEGRLVGTRIWIENSQSPAFRDMDRAIEINGCLCSDACLFAMAAFAGFP
jgi:hypothetical protein